MGDWAVVIAGVASLLAAERVDVVEPGASMPVLSDVDVVLHDTFGHVGIDFEDYVESRTQAVIWAVTHGFGPDTERTLDSSLRLRPAGPDRDAASR